MRKPITIFFRCRGEENYFSFCDCYYYCCHFMYCAEWPAASEVLPPQIGFVEIKTMNQKCMTKSLSDVSNCLNQLSYNPTRPIECVECLREMGFYYKIQYLVIFNYLSIKSFTFRCHSFEIICVVWYITSGIIQKFRCNCIRHLLFILSHTQHASSVAYYIQNN